MAHILIADDDDDIRELVQIQVEIAGHTYTSVADGRAALERLATEEFDLAILDVSMPHATGLSVVAQVRVTDTYDDLPIILMSAFCSASDVQRGVSTGANLYLTKPLTMRHLRDQIDTLLAQRQSRSA